MERIAVAFSPLRDASPKDIIAWARRAEQLGYEAVFIPESYNDSLAYQSSLDAPRAWQYRRDQATVFPVGAMPLRRGESFGTDVNFVVPFNERNNPKFAGCIDRNP